MITLLMLKSERSKPLPTGWFNWILPFWRIPDKEVLDHCSLDAFLFLRYIKMICVICLVGCCITWPVLFPIHATGGGTSVQLDILTIGNLKYPRRYWAHAVLAWIYFGLSSVHVLGLWLTIGRLRIVHGFSRMYLLHSSPPGLLAFTPLCRQIIVKDGTVHLCTSTRPG